jgi:hypothetical protein
VSSTDNRHSFNQFRQVYGKLVDPDRFAASCESDVYLSPSDLRCSTLHVSFLLDKANDAPVSAPKPFFWDWLKRKLRNSRTDLLLLFDCYVTPEFITGFSTILREINGGNPYKVEKLILHGCHLCDVDITALYRLLFDEINATSYTFSCISGCKDTDFQFDDLAKFETVQSSEQLHLFSIRDQMAAQITSGPNDDYLLSLLFSEEPQFANLDSIQLPGFNLSREFVSKFLTVSFNF